MACSGKLAILQPAASAGNQIVKRYSCRAQMAITSWTARFQKKGKRKTQQKRNPLRIAITRWFPTGVAFTKPRGASS